VHPDAQQSTYHDAVRAAVLFVLLAACGGHHHGAARLDDPDHLYVEIAAEGGHRGALRDGAEDGLANVGFARTVDTHGDVELQIEAARLDEVGNTTQCSVKILVLRLPQHDLLGIADGSAHVGGTDGRARNDCLAAVSRTLVHGKVRTLLRRRLDEKR
jgi:hypothetical protein